MKLTRRRRRRPPRRAGGPRDRRRRTRPCTPSAAQVETSPGTFAPQTRYVVANHGFTYVLRESNGDLGGGVFDYKAIPTALRAGKDWAWLVANGTTGAQAHAQCELPALETEAAIRSWQGDDPFYGYVPFQKGSAGLEDDPATWIPVVEEPHRHRPRHRGRPAGGVRGAGRDVRAGRRDAVEQRGVQLRPDRAHRRAARGGGRVGHGGARRAAGAARRRQGRDRPAGRRERRAAARRAAERDGSPPRRVDAGGASASR